MAVNLLDYNKMLTQYKNKQPVNLQQYNTYATAAYRPSTPSPRPQGTQSSGGGGGGGGAPLESTPQQPQIDFDALIAPGLAALDSAETAAGSANTAGIGEAESARQSGIARTNASIGEQTGVLERGKTAQNQQASSAMDEARRQFSEIQQGLQSRYGGTTGTGAFAGEIAGRETLRGIGNIRTGLSNAMLELDTKLQQVKEVGRIALEDVESQYKDTVGKLKANLDSQLAQIRGERGQLQMFKAQRAIEAIQNYQSQVRDIEARNTAFKQQLFLNQQTAEQKLSDALNRAKGTAESFKLYNLSSGGITTPVRISNGGTALDFQGQPVNVGTGSTLYNVGAYPNELDDENPFN